MNNAATQTFPQVSDRIQSLFQDAKRYREARKRREQSDRQLSEQQMQLGLKSAGG